MCLCRQTSWNHTKGSQTCPVSQSDQHETSWSFIWGHAGYIFFETTEYVSNSELLLQYDPNNTFYSVFNEITIVSLWDLAVIIREKLMKLSVIAVLERRDGPARFIVIKCVDSNMSPQFLCLYCFIVWKMICQRWVLPVFCRLHDLTVEVCFCHRNMKLIIVLCYFLTSWSQ